MAAKAKKEAKRLEKLKAEAELWRQMKREELQREMVIQERNKRKIDAKWRELMLQIKEPVFRKDIEVMWHVFERVYDKKDHLMTYTIHLMNVAEDQFARTISSFCDTIDTMINKFLNDLEQMSKDNDVKTYELLRSGERDADLIMSDHTKAETHLQLLLYHAHTTADALAWSTRGENLVKEDEERTKFANDRENLRSLLENLYTNVWDEYKAVLKAYVVNTADNQKQVRQLRRKENMMADIIASQAKKIANSDGLLRRLRLELQAYESGTKQAVFRDRRDRHRTACMQLKNGLAHGCHSDERQLGILVRSADDTVQWLEDAYKKGEKILKLAALCRRYETQREKVMPFGTTRPFSPTETKSSLRQKQSDDSLVANAISTTCGLTRLWQRIASAELAKRALAREKNILEEENAAIVRSVQEFKERSSDPNSYKCICTKKIEQ